MQPWELLQKKNIQVATGVVTFVSSDIISGTLLCKLPLHSHTYIPDNTNRDTTTIKSVTSLLQTTNNRHHEKNA